MSTTDSQSVKSVRLLRRSLKSGGLVGVARCLPAALSIGAHPPLVELADGGGLAAGGIVGEQASAALATHAMEEVPAIKRHLVTPQTTGSASPPVAQRKNR